MTTPQTTTMPRFLMPREVDAIGPQNEAEQHLYQLLRAGMDGAVSETTSIAELTEQLRSQIQSRRRFLSKYEIPTRHGH